MTLIATCFPVYLCWARYTWETKRVKIRITLIITLDITLFIKLIITLDIIISITLDMTVDVLFWSEIGRWDRENIMSTQVKLEWD